MVCMCESFTCVEASYITAAIERLNIIDSFVSGSYQDILLLLPAKVADVMRKY